MTGVDLDAREVRFDELAPITYDFLVLGLGAEVNFFGTEARPSTRFRCTRCPTPAPQGPPARALEAADRDPGLVDDGALNVVIVGGGPTGVETAGAIAEPTGRSSPADYPALPRSKARVILVEAGPELFSMFKPRLRKYAQKALTERTVEVMTGERVASVSPTRVTLKSGEELKAHTLVWGAGLQGNALVQSSGSSSSAGTASPSGPTSPLPTTPRSTCSATSPRSHEERAGPAPAGSVALQSGEHAGEVIARRIAGKATKPFRYRDKGTMAMIGRGAAVVQMLGGSTMTGRRAQAGLGAVHLALLPTNEDRAKAVVDWAGATFTHQRAGRITVRDE